MRRILDVLGPRAPRWLLTSPIAHRGLHDGRRPENTMAAFEAAVQARYPIELDVHASRDGVAVVFHDETLDRLTGRAGRLDHLTAAELGTLRVAGSTQTIPSLADVLDLVAGRVPLVVEVKNAGPVGVVETAVADALSDYRGRITVQSFNPWTLQWFARHAPEHPRGLLSCDFVEEDLPRHQKVVLQNLLLAPLIRPTYVGYQLRCLPHPAPSLLRRLGVPLIAWTIRTEEDLARAREVADNFIFEGIRP